MTDRELMQQALDALNHVNVQDRVQIITALNERLAQPEQEPVAILYPALSDTDMDKLATAVNQVDAGKRGWFHIMDVALSIAQQPPQPEQEPVAEVKPKMTGGNVGIATVIHEIYSHYREPLQPGDKLYITPPQRKPLTDEWIHRTTVLMGFNPEWTTEIGIAHAIVRAAEAAHGIKE